MVSLLLWKGMMTDIVLMYYGPILDYSSLIVTHLFYGRVCALDEPAAFVDGPVQVEDGCLDHVWGEGVEG